MAKNLKFSFCCTNCFLPPKSGLQICPALSLQTELKSRKVQKALTVQSSGPK